MPNVPLKTESLEPHVKQRFIEEVFAVKSKIKILMEKFESPFDSPPVIIIDLDVLPMWSSIGTVAPTPSSAIIQLLISNNFHIKGTHMQMIRENQFDGRIRCDPYRHIADFFEISNLFQYGENKEEEELQTYKDLKKSNPKLVCSAMQRILIEILYEEINSTTDSIGKSKNLIESTREFRGCGLELLVHCEKSTSVRI
ncbi:hypothetical protein Tco_0560841 [Tanacetum coccineum]